MMWREELRERVHREALLAARDHARIIWPPDSAQCWAQIIVGGVGPEVIAELESLGAIEIAREDGEIVGQKTGSIQSYMIRLTEIGRLMADPLWAEDGDS